MKKEILLQKIGYTDDVILEELRKNLEFSFKRFNFGVGILPDQLPLVKSEYNANKNQYNAEKIKNRLKQTLAELNYYRVLGIIDKDIFSGILNFVFGLADIPHGKKITLFALISLTRLKEEFYNREENPALFELRALKEATHELGHTFGLAHCYQFCVMQFSNQLRKTDEKPHTYCDKCTEKMRLFLK